MSDSREYYESRMEAKDELISDMEGRLCALKADMRELEQQVLDARELLQRATLTLTLTMPLRADIERWLEATRPEREGSAK